MKDIFISYSSKDAAIAKSICSLIESHNYNCFFASRDILPGHEYAEELVNALDSVSLIVLLLSDNSNNSPHVLREIERAVSHKKPILVYKLEPVVLNKSMEYFLMTHQWIEREKDSEIRLIQGIDAIFHPKREVVTETTDNVSQTPAAPENPKNNTGRKPILAIVIVAAIVIVGIITIIIAINGKRGKVDEPAASISETVDSTANISTKAPSDAETTEEPTPQEVNNGRLELADTVTFGTYNNEPISWRVIKKNDDGTVVLIASEVLTIKAFDTAENGKYEYFDGKEQSDEISSDITNKAVEWRGSNDWSLSNIRTWLNSSDEVVAYKDQAPEINASYENKNAYSNEPGFLHSFSADELNAIVSTKHLTAANQISTTANADKMVETEDKVFLLSVDELKWLDEAGISRFAKVTEAAQNNDQSGFFANTIKNNYNTDTHLWWLRDPNPECTAKGILANFEAGKGETNNNYFVSVSTFGIRPAIVVNESSSALVKQ